MTTMLPTPHPKEPLSPSHRSGIVDEDASQDLSYDC
uniref:Uncharacterized protein n=1 Tax=Rhizophora mucronata TaxID=61149 RepID=A0A2P2PDU9_RHIMU